MIRSIETKILVGEGGWLTGHEQGVHEESDELGTLRHRPGDDGGGPGGENILEEETGEVVDVLAEELGSAEKGTEDGRGVGTVGKGPADGPVGDDGDQRIEDILGGGEVIRGGEK